MKKLRTVALITAIATFLQLIALTTLFYALVGVKKGTGDSLQHPVINESSQIKKVLPPSSPKADKIVIVVIDALRYDFIGDMKFLKESLSTDDNACLFKLTVEGPTVTLPRIKTLVSGSTSSYWDFLSNLKSSSSMTVDNFLWIAKEAGKKIVFYGDDTWLKLFPDNFFLRSEGVTSFFVTDFYEVDNNVTRNVERELSNGANFDMMILHYLGIDHVGHVHGPTHYLIPEKLEEMDGIIQNIFKELQIISSTSGLPNLLLVTGDHGMANKGGHGGDSLPEITTPLVMLTAYSEARQSALCRKNDAGWATNGFPCHQRDFAAIISFMWALRNPMQSTGHVPSAILSLQSIEDQINVLYVTCFRLLNLMTDDVFKKEALVTLENIPLGAIDAENAKSLLDKLETLRLEIKSRIVETFEQDVFQMFGAVIVITCSLVLFDAGCRKGTRLLTGKKIFIYSIFGASTVALIHVLVAPIGTIWILATFMLIVVLQVALFIPSTLCTGILEKFDAVTMTHFGSIVLCFSSSYVEEEHFLLYYLYSAVVAFGTLKTSMKIRDFVIVVVILGIHRTASSLNSTGQKWNSLLDLNDMLGALRLNFISPTAAFVLLAVLRLKTVCDFVILVGIVILKFNFVISSSSFSQTLVHVLYGLMIVNVATVLGHKTSVSYRFLNSAALFFCLLHKLENIVIVPLVILQVRLIQFTSSNRSLWTTGVMLNSLFLASFFYQGNSNSITTIDISMGYTGLSSYNEYIVGLLTYAGTFSSPILVVLTIASSQTKQLRGGQLLGIDEMTVKSFLHAHFLRLSALNIVFSVVVIIFRQHLFIWSVFIPKLMYQIAFTSLTWFISVGLMLTSSSASSAKSQT